MSHTILLVQPAIKPETRTYSDYESVNDCMEGVCKIYEEHLKQLNPNTPSITYDISQLFDFIDQLTDLSCLVLSLENVETEFILIEMNTGKFMDWFISHTSTHNLYLRYQKSTNTYAPYNKDWIKEKIYVLLRRQAARSK